MLCKSKPRNRSWATFPFCFLTKYDYQSWATMAGEIKASGFICTRLPYRNTLRRVLNLISYFFVQSTLVIMVYVALDIRSRHHFYLANKFDLLVATNDWSSLPKVTPVCCYVFVLYPSNYWGLDCRSVRTLRIRNVVSDMNAYVCVHTCFFCFASPTE